MKDIARMALQKGMEIALDVTTASGDIIVKAGTIVSDYTIQKLSRYDIMLVTIMEEVDYAVTYFEKIRLSKGFKRFEVAYNKGLSCYKQIIDNFIERNKEIPIFELIQIYEDIMSTVDRKIRVLDYLYNMLPTEDDLTYAHCLNSALIAGVFAQWLNMNYEESQTLILCGFLYDIGKLKLPYDLIWKSGKLTPLEFAQIKTHTIIGFQMLQNFPIDDNIIKATLSHHERFDGSGYPSKLHDVQINEYARIIAIIDSYEAMSSARTYRQSKHPFQIIDILEKDAIKYDFTMLNVILLNIGNHMVGQKVLLNNDIKAEVILINKGMLSRPLLKDDEGTFIDLIARKDLEILGIY